MSLWHQYGFLLKYLTAALTFFISCTVAYMTEKYRISTLRRQKQKFLEQNRRKKNEFAKAVKARKTDLDHEEICRLSLEGLQQRLQNGTYTASQVLHAFQRKVVDIDEKLNVVTGYVYEAQNYAENLDRSPTKGPLYGIPFSTKESMALKGSVSCRGQLGQTGVIKEESCLLYKILQDQGAVPFVQTNVPYLSATITCVNPLFGATSNPHSACRHPGGSSGGEGALVASGASVLSLGSDYGGSVRIPAAWCGVVGLKSSSSRLSNKGNYANEANGFLLYPTYGPISQDVDSAAFVMRHLLVDTMWQQDFHVAPLPWKQQIYEDRSRLRIGYYEDNNIVRCVPSVTRALRTARVALEGLGHTVVPFKIRPIDCKGRDFAEMHNRIVCGDGGKTFRKMMEGDPDAGKHFFLPLPPSGWLPRWLNLLIARTIAIFDVHRGTEMEHACGEGSTHNWWELTRDVKTWCQNVTQDFMNARLDAILCPATPSPALLLEQNLGPQVYASYTYVYNLLDWTAGVVPVTIVTRTDIDTMEGYPTDSPVHKIIRKAMDDAEGLPIAVQVATPRFQDELCLRVMNQIEQSVSHCGV